MPDIDVTIDEWRQRLIVAYTALAEIDAGSKQRLPHSLRAIETLYRRGDIGTLRRFAIQEEGVLARKRKRLGL